MNQFAIQSPTRDGFSGDLGLQRQLDGPTATIVLVRKRKNR